LKQQSPSQCETEIRDLVRHNEDLEGLQLLKVFVSLLATLVERGKAYELLQAYLHFLLIVHGESLRRCYSMRTEVEHLQSVLFNRGEELRGQISATLCYAKAMLALPLV
jgi:hypothetical protein